MTRAAWLLGWLMLPALALAQTPPPAAESPGAVEVAPPPPVTAETPPAPPAVEVPKPPAVVVPAVTATPSHWPLVPAVAGARKLPDVPIKHYPTPAANTVDGKVWTSTLYTVSSPLQVEWGYGQVGAQIDADTLGGLPIGVHFDGFVQQRAYYRPLRLTNAPFILGHETYPGRSGVRHPRYFSYDRITEANFRIRREEFNLALGRSIIPSTQQAMVDGIWGDVGILGVARVGGFGGLMPDMWHPRMWLDQDYRSLSGFFPDGEDGGNSAPVTVQPLQSALRLDGPAGPLSPLTGILDGQTLFNLRYFTVGAFASLRFPKFTSDHSLQGIFFNPAAGYSLARNGTEFAPPSDPTRTAISVVDAVLINNLFTFRPISPLNFHLRASWDAWAALRSIDLGYQAQSDLEKTITRYPAVATTFGLRELLADITFRGDWPVGVSATLHHYQSQVTATSYRFYQSDLLRPSAAATLTSANASPNLFNITEPKKYNLMDLATVQRERARMLGWISPLGFIFPKSSMQLYGEGFMEWRRDFPRIEYESAAVCTRDREDPKGVPETYYDRRSCLRNAGNSLPAQDDYVRVGATAGVRDPTLYDNLTYDLSITAMDSWHNRALIARGRAGVQAFDTLLLDMGFAYELSQNQRYYTSSVKFDASGASKSAPPFYPDVATGQAFVFDANVMYRVAFGITFEATYLIMFEEAPVIQDYIVGSGQAVGNPPFIAGYVPRDQHQAQQLVLLRAAYRL